MYIASILLVISSLSKFPARKVQQDYWLEMGLSSTSQKMNLRIIILSKIAWPGAEWKCA